MGGGQLGQESDIPGVSESDTGRQNRPPSPRLFCRKVLNSFWACEKPGQDLPGQNVGRGADDFCVRN